MHPIMRIGQGELDERGGVKLAYLLPTLIAECMTNKPMSQILFTQTVI